MINFKIKLILKVSYRITVSLRVFLCGGDDDEVYSVIFRIILLEKIISEIKLKNNYNIKANIKNIKYEVKQFPVISALEM